MRGQGEMSVVSGDQTMIANDDVGDQDIPDDVLQIDHRRLNRHHGRRHDGLEGGVDGDAVAVLELDGLDVPVVRDGLAAEEGLDPVGDPGPEQVRRPVGGVLLGGDLDLVMVLGDAPHHEQAVRVGDARGHVRPRHGIPDDDVGPGKVRRAFRVIGELVDRIDDEVAHGGGDGPERERDGCRGVGRVERQRAGVRPQRKVARGREGNPDPVGPADGDARKDVRGG